jgi:ABC-type branched-subunit amino acid transport system ATPase component/ABC-type branched-subunit amino acid transport system permease subunit
MQIPLSVIVLGLVTGMIYALLGMGLVLTYKSSRVLNFAYGEMGALGASVVPVLVVKEHLPYWLAILVALVVSAGAGAFAEVVAIRRLARAPQLVTLVATIGLAQLLFAAQALLPQRGLGSAVYPTPFHVVVRWGSVRLTSGSVLILATAPLLALGLGALLRWSRLGLAARAAADNGDAARLAGVPVRKVSLVVWTLTGVLAGASAILLGPTRPIVSGVALGPSLLLRALAAAMVGGLDSLAMVLAAGIGIGVLEAVVQWNYPTGGTLEAVVFAVIVVVFLTRRFGQAARAGAAAAGWSLAGAARGLDRRVATLEPVVRLRRAGLLGAVLIAATLPLVMSNAQRVLATTVVVYALMGLSLVVLTGFAGQLSLGQFAFVGLGALVGGKLHELGYPPLVALLYAVLAGGLAALVVGLPALRIRGLFLAVTTLAFAVAAQAWLFGQHWLVVATSLDLPRPRWLGVDFGHELNYYWLCLAVLVIVAAGVHHLGRTGTGRSMMAVRDNEASAASMGVSPARIKLTAFVIAGMLAALAGYLYGGLLVNFSDPTIFAPSYSLTLVALVVLGGVTTVTGAILGALWIEGLAYVLAPLLPGLVSGQVGLLVSGVGLLVALLLFPGGLAEIVFRARDRLLAELVPAGPPPDEAGARPRLEPAAARSATDALPAAVLEASDVAVRFGGVAALAGVSMSVAAGEIVGLVGPNGAGKTTLFDVLSGMVRPQTGTVRLEGHDVTWLRPEQRARLGLGRTFQQARLFDDLDLLDAIEVALECRHPAETVPSILGLPPSRSAERAKAVRAGELVDLLGLGPFRHRRVAELSTGTRRLAELGCAIGLGARVLLLDEPTAGIAQREVEAFRPVLRQVRDHLDATMVVIEHDLPLIMDLADRMYVMAAGSVIAEGDPRRLREDPAVIAAYLGTDERVIARSGPVAR